MTIRRNASYFKSVGDFKKCVNGPIEAFTTFVSRIAATDGIQCVTAQYTISEMFCVSSGSF